MVLRPPQECGSHLEDYKTLYNHEKNLHSFTEQSIYQEDDLQKFNLSILLQELRAIYDNYTSFHVGQEGSRGAFHVKEEMKTTEEVDAVWSIQHE